LVGLGAADDAAVYKVSDEQAIINTIDFFTPVVDDPYEYGAIAAANSMSDVYAMGGEVTFALNVGAFPERMEPAIISEIFRAVTGLVHPDRYFTKAGAQPGDALVLTKPLGTGSISTALKREIADPAHVSNMVESMTRLNRAASQAAQAVGEVKAATDITGFGLLGHALEMAGAAGCRFVLEMNQVPLLDGATIYAADFVFPGGAANNKLYYENKVTFASTLSEDRQMILWDPQTSGGLLLAVPADVLADFQSACADREQAHWVVGRVTSGSGIEVLP
jgi:selenide,water dikinase